MGLPLRNALDTPQEWNIFRGWLLEVWDFAASLPYFEKARGPWLPNVPYSSNDYVTFDGQTYVAMASHTSGPDFAADVEAQRWFAFNVGKFRELINDATAQVGSATTQANRATTARIAAELARDASFVTGPKYSSEPVGRAAVADGVNFLVQGAAGIAAYEYRRVNASTASTLIATYPSGDAAQVFRGDTQTGETITTNFNDLVKPGITRNNRTTACSNTPLGTAVFQGTIQNIPLTSDLSRRVACKDGLNEWYMCTFVPSTKAIVEPWRRVIGDGQLFAALIGRDSTRRGSFDSNANDPTWGLNYNSCNQAILLGDYWNPKTTAVLFSPFGTAPARGRYSNTHAGPDLMRQTFYKDGLLDEVWSRTAVESMLPSDAAWGGWGEENSRTAKIPARRLADDFPFREVLTSRAVNTDRDCNKALLPGNYTLASGVAVLHTPAGAGASAAYPGTLHTAILGARTLQTLYVYDSENIVWYRSFNTGATPPDLWLSRFNPHAGISLGIVGDSNGAGTPGAGPEGSYLVQIARLMGVAYTNYAVGGAAMEDRPIAGVVTAPINAAAFCNVTASGALAAHNLVLVVQGTNYGTATALGPLNSTDKTQFYGAMRVGYDNIRAGNPNARVVFGLPIYSNAAGNTVQARRDAITAWCQMMNLPVIDFCGKAGINAATAAVDLVDDIHMGPTGHSKAALTGFGQLRALVG